MWLTFKFFVEQAIEISNEFIKGFKALIEFYAEVTETS